MRTASREGEKGQEKVEGMRTACSSAERNHPRPAKTAWDRGKRGTGDRGQVEQKAPVRNASRRARGDRHDEGPRWHGSRKRRRH